MNVTSNLANINDDEINIKIVLDTDTVEYSEDIDIRRVALLSISGDVHWCVDVFGLLSSFTKQSIENGRRSFCAEKYNRKCAIYKENNIDYWLVYNYSDNPKDDFLCVTTVDNILKLVVDYYIKVTVYDGSDIVLLRDFMNFEEKIPFKEYCSSKISTYDGYLLVIRKLLLMAEGEREKENKGYNVWTLAEHILSETDVSDKDLNRYINEHKCPVCGCYFTSYETECVKCKFNGVNNDS